MSRRRLVVAECLVVALLVAGGVAVRGSLVRRGWLFAGSDSYGYLHIADEWRHHGRFAFGPAPQPLEWYRRPLYPMFLVVARGDAPAEPSGGAGWRRIEIAQMLLELFVLWPLLYLTLRRLAGVGAALVGLGLALFYPPAVPFSLAVLTEPVAMTLALVAVAPLVWLPSRRAAWCWALAGVGLALSALLRPDGVLYGAAIVPALFIREIPWRQRQLGAGIFALAFCVLFAPWPIRNWIHFSRAHLTDGMIDRFGNDIPDYRGFWDWMRTWSHDERAAGYAGSCFYDSMCDARTELYGALGAFDDAATSPADERKTVDELLDRRRHEGITPAVSDGFERLAAARRRAHPWKVVVELPARRAIRAWWSAQTEIVDNHAAWPPRFSDLIPHFKRYGRRLFVAMIVSILILLITPRFRMACLVIALPLLARSLILGWTGFSLPRYVAPGYPLCFMLIAIAAYVVAAQALSLGLAARRRLAAR